MKNSTLGSISASRITLHLSRFTHLYSLLLLAFLPFLFFWRLFAPNPLDRMSLPDGDLTQQYFPLRVFAAREIAAGHWPLWNPHLYAGQPGLADSQIATLYPISLLTAWLLALVQRPFTLGVFQLQIVIHYSLAAIFTYAFAQRITHSRFAAWVAALVFTFGGYLISYPAQQPAILESAVWLPLVLLLLDRAAEHTPTRRRVCRLALAGAAMAMSILAGHPQTWLYVLYTALAYWLCAAGSRGQGIVRSPLLFPLSLIPSQWALGLIFVFFTLGLSAVQWLPTLEFTRLSTRAQLGYAFTSTGFALHEIITLVIPGYFGGSPLYVGIIPLLLAGFALLGRKTDDRRRPLSSVLRLPSSVGFWLGLALVALFLAFGDASFVYSLFYLLVPGFAQVRDQERAAFLWSFALAMLAALGAASIRRTNDDERRKPSSIVVGRSSAVLAWLMLGMVALIAFAYVGALASEGATVNLFPGALRQLVPNFFWLLAAWVLWRLHARVTSAPHWLALSVVGLVALNLFSVNGSYNFYKPTPPNYFPETPLTRALKDELTASPLARVASEGLLPGAHNAGAEYGFEDISGNDPLHLQTTAQFDQQMLEPRKLQLLGVRYIITKRTFAQSDFALLTSDGEARLYRYDAARPRAWLAHTAQIVPAEKTFDALNGDEFDPATTVVLDTAPPMALPPAAPSDDAVEVLSHATGRLTVRTRSAANGLLVISEVLYPGWRATLDGQPAPLLPADGVLMAVALPRGDHQVELTFEPDLVKIGAVISALSVLLWGGALLAAHK